MANTQITTSSSALTTNNKQQTTKKYDTVKPIHLIRCCDYNVKAIFQVIKVHLLHLVTQSLPQFEIGKRKKNNIV